MTALALSGGTPVRTQPYPAWPPPGDAEVEVAVAQAVRAGEWGDVRGPRKTELESRFARFHGARHGTAVCNGSVSLVIALQALEVGPGDEVIVPAYTFIATAFAVLQVGARPVFADVEADSACLDPAAVEAAVTSRTKAVIAVHLAGHPADLDRLSAACRTHGLALIEDAAQAHGASYKGIGVGSIGDFGSFSFQTSKNMTAGEGGMVITSDDDLADRVWSLHNCGRVRDDPQVGHGLVGSNYRLSEIQAAMLLPQLDRLPELVTRRQRAADRLSAGLADIDGIEPPTRGAGVTAHAFHLYAMRFDADAFGTDRSAFLQALRAEGIPAGGGYGTPLDRQPAFAQRRFPALPGDELADSPVNSYGTVDLPVTEALCRTHVWLPQFVLLADEQALDQVVEATRKVRDHVAELGAVSIGAR